MMATLAPMQVPMPEVVLELERPENCPKCRGEMTGVELRLNVAASPAMTVGNAALFEVGVRGSIATALPCRCVLHDHLAAPRPAPRYVEASTLTRPAEDAPRAWHAWYAKSAGYFWLPCPLCCEEFGGHEWLPSTPEFEATIPDPDEPKLSTGSGICPACTRAGRGTDAWAASGLRYHLGNLPADLKGPEAA
jgi:hypothetical protein